MIACFLLATASNAQPRAAEASIAGDLSVELVATDARFAAMSPPDRAAIADQRVLYLVREIVYGDRQAPPAARYARVPAHREAAYIDGQCQQFPTIFPLGLYHRESSAPAGIYTDGGVFGCDGGRIAEFMARKTDATGTTSSSTGASRPELQSVDYVFESTQPDSSLRAGLAPAGFRRVHAGFFGRGAPCELYTRTDSEGVIRSFVLIYMAKDRAPLPAGAFRPDYAECHTRSTLYAMGLQGAADMPAALLFELDGEGRVTPAMPSRSWRSTYDVFSNPASVALAVVESLLDGGLLPGDGVSKDGFLAYLERLKELPAERLGDRMRIWPGRFPELGQYAYRRFISPNPPAWGDPPPVTVAP